MFKAISNFLFYQAQCNCIYVEVFDSHEHEFYTEVIDMDMFAFFYMSTPSYPSPIVEDVFFFVFYNFDFFVKHQASIDGSAYVWVFNLVRLMYLSASMLIPCCFYYYSSEVELEIRMEKPLKVCFIVLDNLFFFNYEIEYCSFKICKELLWSFKGNCVESVD